MIAKTKIKTGGVNTSDAAIIVYKNTKEELPLVGKQKILYLVIPTSELYIWTGDAYCKINGVLEDTLSNLAEKFKNDSELSSSEFAALSLRLEEVDYETQKKFIETYATIESVATSQEGVKQELNETLNLLSQNLETYREESGKELSDLATALKSAEAAIDNVNTNMGEFMKDGVFETAEIAAIGQMYNQLSQTFNTLNKEYNEAVAKIESIVDKNQNNENFDEDSFFQEEFPYFLEMKNIWADEEGNALFNDANIGQYIHQLQQNKISLDSFNLNSLFNFILCLCLHLPKDKIASSDEIAVWNNANTKLTDKLNSFEECLRQTMAAIALFDANDELQEAVGNINSVMNGLQKQIDGQIINWNDKGIPLPLYDHSTNKWFDGAEWVDTVQTEHRGPSLDWDDKYDQHINDTYVDLSTGSAYRWCNTDVGYHWCKITDTATEEVLKRAAELEGALDRKTTTFLQNYPTHPYHKGDLWIVHTNYEGYKKGEILNCVTDSIDQFDIKDWSRECTYTDDSKADELYEDMLSKLDTKFNSTMAEINKANKELNNLGLLINSRPTTEQLNQAIQQAKEEIQEDITEATAIIDYSFEDNKITPSEKQALLAELREICGYLFKLTEQHTISSYVLNRAGAFKYSQDTYYYINGVAEDLGQEITEHGSYGSMIDLLYPDIDFSANSADHYDLEDQNLYNLHTALYNLITLYNSFKIGNLTESTTISGDLTKQQLTQAFTNYYNQEQAIIKFVQEQYSDKSVNDNNKKQLINVNNLICNNREIWVRYNTATGGYTYKPATLSKICKPNTLTMQFNSTYSLTYNQVKVHTLKTNTSESLVWDKVEEIGVTMSNFQKTQLGSNLYKYTIKFISTQDFNSIAIYFPADKQSGITEACLYEDDLTEIMFKPGIPDIDLQALWKNLKLLAKATNVELTSITPSLPN